LINPKWGQNLRSIWDFEHWLSINHGKGGRFYHIASVE
jgi:hypothetical protein